jgi:hypothetical protein
MADTAKPERQGHDSITGGLLFLAIGLIVSTWLAASAWERVKMRPADRTIQVTGSAKKSIVSDQIGWSAGIATLDTDRTAAYHALAGHMKTARDYLASQGIRPEEISVASAEVEEVFDTEYQGSGEERIQRRTFRGYKTSQGVSVRSNDVARVERVSREITQLLEKGVPISSQSPSYFYTKIGELKIEMLAEAARDARARAENMLDKAGGGKVGKLRAADMGVININPVNSTDTSWEGKNDTTSLEKDILTIVHVTYEVD